MKILLLALPILAVFVQAQAAVTPYEGLATDLQKFLDLIDKDRIIGLFLSCLAIDEEIQDAVEFIESDEFKKTVLEVEAIPEYKEFIKYLYNNGLNVYELLSKLHEILGLPPFVPPARAAGCGGIRGFVDTVEGLLPLERIKALYYELLQTSDAFKSFVAMLRSDELNTLVQKLAANTGVQSAVHRLEEHNIDVAKVLELLRKLFGWDIGA